jgi:hypothetical protein
MTDPRNVAHDKKIQQEKKHHGEKVSPDADEKPQPGKKPHQKHHSSDPVPPANTDSNEPVDKP